MNRTTAERNAYLMSRYPEMFVALNYHRTHKNEMMTFVGMSYLRDIYLDQSDYIVFKKATQMGISEYLVIRAIVASSKGRGVFYVLPTGNLVGRFVKNRIDRSMEFTPYYRSLLKTNPSKFSESVSLKHIASGSIAFIGSNATSGFTEYPADDLIVDEMDECDMGNLNMAVERLSASTSKKIIKVGNPTILNYGIDEEFNKSDGKQWYIKCEHCGEWFSPNFFLNVVREVEERNYMVIDEKWNRTGDKDVRLMCHKCDKPVDRHYEGEWREQKQSDVSGYHVNKLFSKNVDLRELLTRFEEGLNDDSKLQRFYNGDLGEAYTATGAKLNYDMLNECKGDYLLQNRSDKPCVMGVDVGNKLHTLIAEVMPDKTARLVHIGMENDKEDIFDLCRRFNVKFGVIDALPERRLVKEICGRVKGIFQVYYGNEKVEKVDVKNRIITVDRTASLDAVKEAILTKAVIFPKNADKLEPFAENGMSEFFYELCTSTRVFDEDRQLYEWAEGGNPDHFLHSLNYLLISLRILMKAMR